jgi:3-hydroxybutyryl-CoA dehydrogenase
MSTQVIVVGAGQMGRGIAQVCAQSGYNVCLFDEQSTSLQAAEKNIAQSLNKLAEKKLLLSTPEDILKNIKFSSSFNDLDSNAQFLIEAITENISIKKTLFTNFDKKMNKDCIFASNTSSISITELAASTSRPDKFIGMHFMNPVPLMKLVEVILGLRTSAATKDAILALSSKLGKTTVLSKDVPGFIVNRILMPMINEACFVLAEGIASAEDIDTAMKLGTNQPMGPLALADFIGLDTCLYIMNVLHDGLGDDKYRPSPMLKQYVDAGYLGKKSGLGFFKYSS